MPNGHGFIHGPFDFFLSSSGYVIDGLLRLLSFGVERCHRIIQCRGAQRRRPITGSALQLRKLDIDLIEFSYRLDRVLPQ